MKKVRDRFLRNSENGPYIEPGAVLRGIGAYPHSYSGPHRQAIPVVFAASPYLKLSPLRDRQSSDEEYYPRTLLQNLYGFDVTPNRDKNQIIRKICPDKQPNEALHVDQMWCLLIGSTTLITMSGHAPEDLLTGTITKRTPDHELPVKIEIIDDECQRSHAIVISSNTTWVDLFNITMEVAQKKRSDLNNYELRDPKSELLTAERWIKITKSKTSQPYTFHLGRKISIFIKPRRRLEYSRHSVHDSLGGFPTKRRRSDESCQTTKSSRKESETRESTTQSPSKKQSSPSILHKEHNDLMEAEQRMMHRTLLEQDADYIIVPPIDQPKETTPSVKDVSFPGNLRPETRLSQSISMKSSLDMEEDASTLQATDDNPAVTRRNSDAQDPYELGKEVLSQNLRLTANHLSEEPNPLGIVIPWMHGQSTDSAPRVSFEHSSRRSMINGGVASTMSDTKKSIVVTKAEKNAPNFSNRRYQGKATSSGATIEPVPAVRFHPSPRNSTSSYLAITGI